MPREILARLIELAPKNGETFSAYISIDPQTNEVLALRADRVSIPKEIKGVTLSDQQYKDLVEGKAVKVEGMTSKNGKSLMPRFKSMPRRKASSSSSVIRRVCRNVRHNIKNKDKSKAEFLVNSVGSRSPINSANP